MRRSPGRSVPPPPGVSAGRPGLAHHGTPELAPGDLLTAAFTLPSGRPCKVHATVVRRDRQGWGVQFQEVLPHSLTNLHRYWAALE